MHHRHLHCLVATLAACVGTLTASDALIEPGNRLAVIDTAHIHAMVPADCAERLKPMIARAEVIYTAMARDAGYVITKRLDLLLTDDVDDHNGYSFVTPFPLVNIELAPSLQPSGIFTGSGVFERTLTHELTHHFSNDREPNGFRRVMEDIFGRVLPNDLVSLVIAYLSIPAHEFSPTFWHEGCAQWAETTYAPAGSAWGGRGRDSLSHMVWRLDAAEHAIPPVGEWRGTYQRWPFGNRVYLYGLAYLRYLDGAYGGRASIWQMIEAQEHRWPFAFNSGGERLLGEDHAARIAEARAALQDEQDQQLGILRSQPVTATRRLTAVDGTVSAPAWLRDGKLLAAFDGVHDRPTYITVDAAGDQSSTCNRSLSMGAPRSLVDGTVIYSEAPAELYPWRSSLLNLITPRGHHLTLEPKRVLQPDVRKVITAPDWYGYQVVGLHLLPASRQELVMLSTRVDDGWLFATHDETALVPLATQGIPWSPAFRPGHEELSWVETDEQGSRLVLAPLVTVPAELGAPARWTLGERSVLATVKGRIIHPSWSADGAYVFVCADHSGVANAYRIDPAKPGELVPVTNVIGGVTACVPSFDGKELAVVDYDRHGSYLARLPADPASWPKQVPAIALAWPAPVPGRAPAPGGAANAGGGAPPANGAARANAALPGVPAGPGFQAVLPADAGKPDELTVTPYHGLTEIRPLFWTPTTAVVPEGGYGISGMMADPVFTHEFIGGAGAGPYRGSPVGFAGYVYGGWPLDVSVAGWQSERNFNDQIVDSTGQQYDYTEDVRTGEVRVGQGLSGFTRRFQAYVGAGIAEYRPVHAQSKKYHEKALINLAPFSDVERFAEATVAYDDSAFFPASYSYEDGSTFAITYRHSGYGGELHGNRVLGLGTYVLSFLPDYGQELAISGAAGWSDGDRYLQGQFSVGGVFGVNSLPRGYIDTQAVGSYLAGGSFAYRTPVWRPFTGFSTTPFVNRQEVLELFFDAAKVSTDHFNGNGQWYRSVGAELHVDMVFWEAILNPGIGVARQLDGKRDWAFLFDLDFLW